MKVDVGDAGLIEPDVLGPPGTLLVLESEFLTATRGVCLNKPGKCRGLEAENGGKLKKQMLAGIDASNAV